MSQAMQHREETPKKPLSFIQPRDTKRVVKARNAALSGTITKVRHTLITLAVIVIVAIILWPVLNPNKLAHTVMANIPDLVIQNLHFTGLNSKNEPYSMNAIKATRPSGDKTIYDLDQPEGEITLKSGSWIDGKAQVGRYDQENRKLWLGGNVQLFQDNGDQFTTDEAQIDLDNNNAWGEKPVLIQGSFGEIHGTGFRFLDSGNVMVVKGPAHAVLNLLPAPSSDKPAETHK